MWGRISVFLCVLSALASDQARPAGAGAFKVSTTAEVYGVLKSLEINLRWADKEVVDAYNKLCEKWESARSVTESAVSLRRLYVSVLDKDIDKDSAQKIYEEGNLGRLQAFSLLSQLKTGFGGVLAKDLADFRLMLAKEHSFLCDYDDVIKGAQAATKGEPLDPGVCAAGEEYAKKCELGLWRLQYAQETLEPYASRGGKVTAQKILRHMGKDEKSKYKNWWENGVPAE